MVKQAHGGSKDSTRTGDAQNIGHWGLAPCDNGTNREHRKEATLTRYCLLRKLDPERLKGLQGREGGRRKCLQIGPVLLKEEP